MGAREDEGAGAEVGRVQRLQGRSWAKLFESGESFQRVLTGFANHWWALFPPLAASAARFVVLTDRNVYVCRTSFQTVNYEVLGKYPLGSVELRMTRRPWGRRLQIGADESVCLSHTPFIEARKVRQFMTRADELAGTPPA